MTIDIACPECGGIDWKAIEQFTSLTPCRLAKQETGEIEIQFDMRAELAREAATSIVLAYACSTEDCGYTMNGADLN